MPDGNDENKEDVVVDLEDDAVVARSDPPLTVPTRRRALRRRHAHEDPSREEAGATQAGRTTSRLRLFSGGSAD